MATIQATQARLDAAQAKKDVLAVGWDAFQLIQQVLTNWAEPGSDRFPAFMYAIDAACDGRDQLGFAPATPEAPATDHDPATMSASAAAGELGQLAGALSAKLNGAATESDSPVDRVACLNAAAAANRIARLLGST